MQALQKTLCKIHRKELKYTLQTNTRLKIFTHTRNLSLRKPLLSYSKKPSSLSSFLFDCFFLTIISAMIMHIIGKKPLSLLLGWGEVTLTRFLEGQIPTVQYSEQLKALKNADCFSKLLEKNGSKITPTAYKKAKAALENSKQAEKIDISRFALLKPYPQYAYNVTFKGGFACTNHSCPC